MRGNGLRGTAAAVLLACGVAACGRVDLQAAAPADAAGGSRLRVRAFVVGSARAFADFFDTATNRPCSFAGAPPQCVPDPMACDIDGGGLTPGTDFVTAIDHVWQPTGGAITVDEARASDGSTYALGLVDVAHATACSASDTGGNDDIRCVPPDAVAASKALGCPVEVVKLAAPSRAFAGNPRLARIASSPERFVRLVPASDARYRDPRESGCASLPDGQQSFFTDGDVPRDELPAMRRSLEPANAPLATVVWRDPDGRRLGSGGLFDAQRGACTPQPFEDGALRCVPDVRITSAGDDPGYGSVFADAACTQPLFVLSAPQPGYVVRMSGCAVHSVAHRVLHPGPVYAPASGGCAEVRRDPRTLYFELVEETDLPAVELE